METSYIIQDLNMVHSSHCKQNGYNDGKTYGVWGIGYDGKIPVGRAENVCGFWEYGLCSYRRADRTSLRPCSLIHDGCVKLASFFDYGMPPDIRTVLFIVCGAVAVSLLNEFNRLVTEPYMVCLSHTLATS